MNTNQFNFECDDKYSPFELLSNRLKEIEKATKGYVVGIIRNYDGPIDNYVETNGVLSITKALGASEKKINIQDHLGDISETKKNKYEVVLTAKILDKYKYRIMFVEYGELSYPAKVVLNESISRAILESFTFVQTIKSMKQLDELIDKIFSSKYFIEILQGIINESIRRENNA